MRGKVIFIAGTDTNVGKSVVTGLLAYYIGKQGRSVVTQKWVQTGSKRFPIDIRTHLFYQGKKQESVKKWLSGICPYVFKKPASPHLSAKLENKTIDLKKLKQSTETLREKFDYVLVEGVGGVHVPVTENKLLVDLVADLRLPTIVVAQNKLGVINHALLTIEALQSRNVPVLGVVYNSLSSKVDKNIRLDNPKIISVFTKVKNFGVLLYDKDLEKLRKSFIPIGKNILKNI